MIITEVIVARSEEFVVLSKTSPVITVSYRKNTVLYCSVQCPAATS